jgi:thymidylate synthase ThyX
MFWVEMRGIPTFVSVHLVRHKIGVEHFVQSNRTDVVETIADRNTPINHAMLLNAQSLVNLSRKRLCMKASKETREVMQEIKNKVGLVDEILPKYMVKDCEYRGKCVERNPCKGV